MTTTAPIRPSSRIRQDFLDFFKSKQHTIVPSSSLLPDSPNLLFTNAGMNQFVPIFLGQAQCPYKPGRAADTQKCIRAGGKHNDLEDVGLDTYHHTFFEMLGNWSFGDYFKTEAIDWAWELITEVWKFPPERLYATIYNPDKSQGDPSERDEEAWNCWADKFRAAGLDPAVHIVYGGKQDNFWMMGDTGPCGPCSELHVDLTPGGNTNGSLVNKGDARCIEIWNLVFIQFNANPDGTFSPLPARHVDTGMGFERVTSIIQGTKNFKDFANAKISNYETDIFRPIFDALEKLSGKKYGSTLPPVDLSTLSPQHTIDIAFRVIADHIRTLGFAIADGIQPSNEGRGYVLRRILRRAVRYSRALGFKGPFFYKLVTVLADTMGDVFPEIRARKKHIQEIIRVEEEMFNKTLDRGIELFAEEARRVSTNVVEFPVPKGGPIVEITDFGSKVIAGEFAFKLYDTYGFPLDLTELMARERGMTVDRDVFEKLMEEQRTRARAAQKKEVISLSKLETATPTKFVGYDQLVVEARVLEVVSLKNKTAIVLDTSACYAEMGGQVGDTGEIVDANVNSRASALSQARLRVTNTQKSGNTWLHFVEGGDPPATGSSITLAVDKHRRNAIERHHTVTHLLHWALHEVVSREASQKGSFVGPDKLTFDFNSVPLTPQQVADIEKLVNERILENAGVSWTEVPYAEVKSRKDVMQFFGDKYGDAVRVVQVGGRPKKLDGYSMELCGGTHTRATGEIGLFRIIGEGAIAAGVRRIEAVAGLEAYRRATDEVTLIQSLSDKVNSPVHELEKKIEALLEHQKMVEKQLKSAQQREASNAASRLLEEVHQVNEIPVILHNLGAVDGDFLQAVADSLKERFKGVIVLGGGEQPGSVALVAAVTPDYIWKIQAGKIVQQIAPIVGGKGGGKPDNARGGGKDASKLDEALAMVKTLLH
ncbi:MAG TPA: alanine--tRNA ligase [Candidatus Limnocylindrales bacterium]|nr:alanine--tRNA ligase [Candidatus Limnocylindrales bacterium]